MANAEAAAIPISFVPISEIKAFIVNALDNLPPDAVVVIDRGEIEIEPKDGWRQFRPGNKILLTIERPQVKT